MKQVTKEGVIGGILLLAVFGGSIYLTPEQAINSFVCEDTMTFGIFPGGLSESNKTAYYNESKAYCRTSWVPLEDYLEWNNLTVEDVTNPEFYECSCKYNQACECCNTNKCEMF